MEYQARNTPDNEYGALYFTDDTIASRRTLSLMTVLFDAVYVMHLSPQYFLKPLAQRWETEKNTPMFTQAPIRTELATQRYLSRHMAFVEENRELVTSGVLRPMLVDATPPDWAGFEEYEQRLLAGAKGLRVGMWGEQVGLVPEELRDKAILYVDMPMFSLYRWQAMGSALMFALRAGLAPISDNDALSSLTQETVTRLSTPEERPPAASLSSLLAFETFSTLLPDLGELSAQEILCLREILRDELGEFRNEMSAVSCQVSSSSTVPDRATLQAIVVARVKPKVDELEQALRAASKRFDRDILKSLISCGGGATMLGQAVNAPDPAKFFAFAAFAGTVVLNWLNYRADIDSTLSHEKSSGLSLLIKLRRTLVRG